FHHVDSSIENSVEEVDKGILSGLINFRNNIGNTEFIVKSKGNDLFKLTIKVFPTKIDYEEDYKQLMEDINKEVYNLSFDFLKRTFQEMSVTDQGKISDSEFFSILINIFESFLKAFRRVDNQTHHKLENITTIKRAGKVKRISRQGIKWVNKNPQFYNKDSELPTKFLDVDKRITYDTFENKFVKWMIKDVIIRVENFKIKYLNSVNEYYGGAPDKKVLEKIEYINKKLKSIIHLTFLKDVGDIYKLDSLSLVLQMAPGYRSLYKYYVMLKKGLTIESDLFKLSMKDTAELYEYWCFLKINQILREEYKLISEDLVKFNYSGINVSLSKGKESIINYINLKTNEEFKLSYNKSSGKEITVGQKPDYILELEKNNSKVKYKFIFDAKYRIDTSKDNGPTKESINAMHRYRDAIVSEEEGNFKRTMVGAYVLFPNNNEDKYKNHKFYKSIEKMNIGGYPFLPGSIKLMSEFLKKLIEESPLDSYERNILPIGNEEYSDNTKFNQNVLIGSIRSKEQLKFIKENKIYHMPIKEGDDFLKNQVEYISIYQSKGLFGNNSVIKFYAKIKKWKIKNRKTIPFRKVEERKDTLYHYFELEEIKELENPIEVRDFGVSNRYILTNNLLLQRAKYFPELTLKDSKEWRIWIELNRIRETYANENKYNFKINNIKFKVENNILFSKKLEKNIENWDRKLIHIMKILKNLE
ncbi:MAG: restriction endonuclease-like protein, partial [Bacillota bacterium]|nr:restriction endonuclease-like protein [Bacillota bacterium]